MQKQLTDSNHKPTHEEVAKLAYSIFEKSGRIPGRDRENWFEAEAQLMAARKNQRQAPSTPAKPITGNPSRPAARALVNH